MSAEFDSPNLFKLLRIAHNLPVSEVCEKTGLSQSYISELERGKKKPSLKTFEALGELYHMKPSAIMRLSEGMPVGKNAYQKGLFSILQEILGDDSMLQSDEEK